MITWISALLYLIYNLACYIKNKGENPISLSATYYFWPKWIFPTAMTVISITLLPGWLDVTEGSNLQFLSFLSCVGMIVIGLVPDYKNDSGQYKWHMIIAYTVCALSLISVLFVTREWYWILVWLVSSYISDPHHFKQNYVYHIEDILISSVYLAILF